MKDIYYTERTTIFDGLYTTYYDYTVFSDRYDVRDLLFIRNNRNRAKTGVVRRQDFFFFKPRVFFCFFFVPSLQTESLEQAKQT